jgi:transcriptional regulator with XRE-family HTH domain
MARGQGPTVRRRRLASELRRLREAANLTIDDVAAKLECSASKVSRIETGHTGVTPRDARDMLQLYDVPPDQVEALVQLSREARKKGWWQAYQEVFSGAFPGLESDASSLRAFQALLVPGLLQTEDYVRAVIRSIRPGWTDADVERRVAARTERQRILTEPDPPNYWAVIDEAVLSRTIGGVDVMHGQMLRLCERAALPNVTIQVVPFEAGAHSSMEGPYLILGFPEQSDPDVVYVDTTTGGVYLEEQADVQRYTLMFDHLRASALSPEDSLRRVEGTTERLFRQREE